jgi:hypothetical protein
MGLRAVLPSAFSAGPACALPGLVVARGHHTISKWPRTLPPHLVWLAQPPVGAVTRVTFQPAFSGARKYGGSSVASRPS